MSLINSANIVLLATLYLMTSTHLKYSTLFELLKNKTKCMDFAVLSVTGTKYRVTRVYWRAQSIQSLSVCAETFRNENFWTHLQTFDMWNYEPVFRWHKAALPPAVHHGSHLCGSVCFLLVVFSVHFFLPSEFVKSKTMYFPQLSQSHSLFSSLNCYCSTHDPFSLSQPPPHTPTHTPHRKNKSLKYTHHRGWEHSHCETRNPELQSCAGTPTHTRAGTCDIQTQQETKTQSFFRHFLLKSFVQWTSVKQQQKLLFHCKDDTKKISNK